MRREGRLVTQWLIARRALARQLALKARPRLWWRWGLERLDALDYRLLLVDEETCATVVAAQVSCDADGARKARGMRVRRITSAWLGSDRQQKQKTRSRQQ